RRVKLKITPGWDVDPVKAVRTEFGDDLMLQVDANGSYRPSDVDALRPLDDFGLRLIEQPFPADALLAHAGARKSLRTPICLDETVTSLQVAADALALKACDVLSIKPGLVGGLRAATAIHDLAQGHGVDLFCGGMLETGVGRAANVALASLPGFTLPGDLSPSRRWFADDITAPLEMIDGSIPVPTGPGIGVDPDADALETFTVSRDTVR
ncbi:MAG: enolase C-terminal domain-like protein, partial [Acidimicrobiales bacterium]